MNNTKIHKIRPADDQPGVMLSKANRKGGAILRPIQKVWLRRHSKALVLGIGSLMTLWYVDFGLAHSTYIIMSCLV